MDRTKKHAEHEQKTEKRVREEVFAENAGSPGEMKTGGKESGSGSPGANENDRRSEERRKKDRRADVSSNESKLVHSLRDDLKKKDEEIEKIRSELDAAKDTMLRRQADFENYKKRMAKSQADQRKFIIRDFALDIILINDDLHRAIEASESIDAGGDAHSSFVDGVSMISKRIEDTLSKYGIEEVDSLGKEFDPNFNEAVEIEMSGDVEVDTVTQVYQKGFHIDDVVVRNARVKVAKPARQFGQSGAGGDDAASDSKESDG